MAHQRTRIMPHKTIRISIAIGLIVGLVGCAGTRPGRATMDLAITESAR